MINLIREHNPKTINLNETFLKPNMTALIKNYDAIRKDRHDGYGGIITYIHKDLGFKEISLEHIQAPPAFQMAAIELKTSCLFNIYNPPTNMLSIPILQEIYNTITSLTNKPTIFLGDLNAQHGNWG